MLVINALGFYVYTPVLTHHDEDVHNAIGGVAPGDTVGAEGQDDHGQHQLNDTEGDEVLGEDGDVLPAFGPGETARVEAHGERRRSEDRKVVLKNLQFKTRDRACKKGRCVCETVGSMEAQADDQTREAAARWTRQRRRREDTGPGRLRDELFFKENGRTAQKCTGAACGSTLRDSLSYAYSVPVVEIF